jgi:hypothetical protein
VPDVVVVGEVAGGATLACLFDGGVTVFDEDVWPVPAPCFAGGVVPLDGRVVAAVGLGSTVAGKDGAVSGEGVLLAVFELPPAAGGSELGKAGDMSTPEALRVAWPCGVSWIVEGIFNGADAPGDGTILGARTGSGLSVPADVVFIVLLGGVRSGGVPSGGVSADIALLVIGLFGVVPPPAPAESGPDVPPPLSDFVPSLESWEPTPDGPPLLAGALPAAAGVVVPSSGTPFALLNTDCALLTSITPMATRF